MLAANPPLPPESVIRASFVPTLTPVGGLAVMPDVTGLSARTAMRVLSGLGLDVRIKGSGFATAQSPEPGSPIDPGAIASIQLERYVADDRGFKGVR